MAFVKCDHRVSNGATDDMPHAAGYGQFRACVFGAQVYVEIMKRKGQAGKAGMDAKVLMEYDRWVAKHLDEMSRKYPHKVIAVYGGRLIAVGDSYKEVYAAARARGIEEYPFAMEVPAPEDVEAIL